MHAHFHANLYLCMYANVHISSHTLMDVNQHVTYTDTKKPYAYITVIAYYASSYITPTHILSHRCTYTYSLTDPHTHTLSHRYTYTYSLTDTHTHD